MPLTLANKAVDFAETPNQKYTMRYVLLVLFLGLLSVYSQPVLAQAPRKFEKESRIKRADVPSEALAFIDSLALRGRVKWYMEQGLESQSIEAKFRNARQKFSVEFDTSGRIEDVEIEIQWSALKPALQAAIDQRLNEDCDKFLVDKIQEQHIGSRDYLQRVILNRWEINLLNPRYELVVRCKKNIQTTLFEYLFDATGKELAVTEIVLKPSSHLEY